jgi:hypothetical protein
MVEQQLLVGLVVERWPPVSVWGSITWRGSQVLPQAPEVAPWTVLGRAPERDTFYAGAAVVTLYSTETANYLDNLGSGSPKLWVILRPSGDEPPVDVIAVTADPSEGEAFTEAGNDSVDPVAMPPEIAAMVAAFIEAHHVERPFEKRKRDTSAFEKRRPKGAGLDRGVPEQRIDGSANADAARGDQAKFRDRSDD